MPKPSHRRRKVIVDKEFQWKSTIIGLIYIMSIAIFVAIPFVYLLKATDGLLSGYSEELTGSFAQLQTITMVAGSLFIILMAAAWIRFSLKRSHRIAGPIINFKRVIDEFAKGNFAARIKLREKDELQAVADALNSMAENLRAREQTLNERLRNQIRAAKEEVFNSSTLENTQAILEQLESEIASVLDQKQDPSSDAGKTVPEDQELNADPEKADEELLLR